MKQLYVLLLLYVAVCLNGCKKDAVTPQPAVSLTGKWFIARHTIKLVNAGVQVAADTTSAYTKDDFIQYFENGTGVISVKPQPGYAVILTIFKYTYQDAHITQFSDGGEGVDETVTRLTATELAIHYETIVPDPADPHHTINELDDFEFTR